jgi:oligosaccharyltransferase complex subunit epsilon
MASNGSIKQIFSKFVEDYNKNRTKKFMMVDSLMAYAFVTAIVQLVYMILVGTFPFNSFLSGFFCHLGLFALAGECRFIVYWFT